MDAQHRQQRPSVPVHRRTDTPGPVPGWALAGAGFTLAAVALEVAGSVWGDSPSTSYPGWLATIGWPTPLRVLWWTMAAAGVVAMNLGMARASGSRRPVRTVVAAAPFVAFALGIASGAQWATWH